MSLFTRRQKLPLYQRVLRLLWPHRGWKRAGLYYWRKFSRVRGTPQAIAHGFAVGFSVSFTPFIGAHILISLFFCWLMRASYVAAVIATLIFNPVTAVPIIAFTYHMGLSFMSAIGVKGAQSLPDIWSPSGLYDMATTNFMHVFLPWLSGGVLVALCVYPFAYMIGIMLVRLRDNLKAQKKTRPAP